MELTERNTNTNLVFPFMIYFLSSLLNIQVEVKIEKKCRVKLDLFHVIKVDDFLYI